MKLPRVIFFDLILLAVLAGFFSYVYLSTHAFGATSGDSPGYIFNAGRMYKGLPLAYEDDLVRGGLTFFGDVEKTEWLAPLHSSIANSDGAVVSKYPVGISLLMNGAARITGSDTGFYVLVPLMAVLNVLLVYLLSRFLWRSFGNTHVRAAVAFASAGLFGLSELVLDHAIAYPLRDIPVTTFLLASLLFLFLARLLSHRPRWFVTLLTASSVFFAFGLNIRHTLIATLPGFLLLFFFVLRESGYVLLSKKTLYVLGIAASFSLVAISPTLLNSYRISTIRDTSSLEQFSPQISEDESDQTGFLSNADHVQDLRFQNLYDNQGRFRQGVGSLFQYWNVVKNGSSSILFLPLIFFGILFGLLNKEKRWETLALTLSGAGTFFLFSMWINPYGRYVIPTLPFMFLFLGLGFLSFFTFFSSISSRRLASFGVVLACLSFGMATVPRFTDAFHTNEFLWASERPMSSDDLETFQSIGSSILEQSDKPLLLIVGPIKSGIPEMIMTHTDVRSTIFPEPGISDRENILPAERDAYLSHLMEDGYDIFLWVYDPADTNLDAYPEARLMDTYTFTFYEEAYLFHLNPS